MNKINKSTTASQTALFISSVKRNVKHSSQRRKNALLIRERRVFSISFSRSDFRSSIGGKETLSPQN
jgi:hypothetical protein